MHNIILTIQSKFIFIHFRQFLRIYIIEIHLEKLKTKNIFNINKFNVYIYISLQLYHPNR